MTTINRHQMPALVLLVALVAGTSFGADELRVTTLAGSHGLAGCVNGSGSSVRFNAPLRAITDSAGNVYVEEGWCSGLRKITPEGLITHRFTDLPVAPLAFGPGDVLYGVEDEQTIVRIGDSGHRTTVAGEYRETCPWDCTAVDGLAPVARFVEIRDLAVDGNGNIYVIDSDRVRRISSDGTVSTVAGADSETFSWPTRIAVDRAAGSSLLLGMLWRLRVCDSVGISAPRKPIARGHRARNTHRSLRLGRS